MANRTLLSLCLHSIFIALSLGYVHADESSVMHAGIAAVDITPDYPVRLNGFGGRRNPSEGIRQHIWAKALAVGTSDRDVVVVITVDTLGIPDDLTERLAANLAVHGLSRDRLAVCASHTHSGPMIRNCANTLFGEPIPEDHWKAILKYSEELETKLEQVAVEALKNRKPAKLSFGIGTVGFAMNRRQAGGPVDHDLPVLAVRNPDDTLRAVFTNYACHCVTLSDDMISGDWAGYAMDHIQRMNPGCDALISIGCGADSNPRGGVLGSKFEVADQLGLELADVVQKVLTGSMTPITKPPIAKTERVRLPLAKLPTRDEWQQKATMQNAIGYHSKTQLERLDRGESLMTEISYPIQSISFGDQLTWVFLPGEVVVDYSLRLKSELDCSRLWINAYANACPGYVPSERILREGGYEGGGAMVYYDIPTGYAAGLEQIIVDAVKGQAADKVPSKFNASKTNGVPPKSPAEGLASLQLSPGFKAELVASEPMIESPVAISFGPDGRLWVAEMSDYPQGRPESEVASSGDASTDGKEDGGQVRCLVDDNNDGRFDRSTIFLSGIPFPTGVTAWRNGVLVCAAPDILYAEDTDNDGKADRVETLFTGFATHNYQARVNSLEYGLDGWVYGACGLFGGEITSKKTGEVMALGQRDFRIDPDRGIIEPVSGNTQQGRVRNDNGDWFGCNNTTLLMHYPLTEEKIRRNPFLTPPQSVITIAAGPDPGRLYPASNQVLFMLSGPPGRPTAACGLGIYRDSLLGTSLTGNTFTCEPVNNLVHRQILDASNATFQSRRSKEEATSEFLSSKDPWFRPVQARTGPDGALWVVDMYRYVIEHPIWIPPDTLATLDPRAGSNLGRIYRIVSDQSPARPIQDLTKLTSIALAQAMDSPNGTQRDLVQQLIQWRGDRETLPELRRIATGSTNASVRIQAASTCANLDSLSTDLLIQLLADSDAQVRCHAIRLAEPQLMKSDELTSRLKTLAADQDFTVRMQLAYAAGAMPAADSSEVLTALLKSETQTNTTINVHMMSAIESSLRPDTMAAVLRNSSSMQSSQVTNRILVASARMLPEADLKSTLDALWTACTTERNASAFDRTNGFLVAARERPDFDAIKGAFDLDRVEDVMAVCTTLAADDAQDVSQRTSAVRLLSHSNLSKTQRTEFLVSLLSSKHPADVQTAAIDALRSDGSDRVVTDLLQDWSVREPRLRRQCVALMLSRPTWARALLAEMAEGGVAATELDLSQQQSLLDHSDETIQAAAAISFKPKTSAARQEIIARYTAALNDSGDAAKGRQIYQKHCSNCHRLQDMGHNVGPEIAGYSSKPPQALLFAMLDPNQAVDPRYQSYVAVLNDGRSITGIVAEEAAASLTLMAAEAKKEVIARSEIDEVRGTGKSLMPEGFEQQISPDDLNHLLAWFATLRTPPKTMEGNRPSIVSIPPEGNVALTAAQAEIYGGNITFELPFQNIGYWHSEDDHVRWRIHAEKSRTVDVWAEWACAPDSQGNSYVVDGVEPALTGTVAATGAWSDFKLIPLGRVTIREGDSEVVMRPNAPLRSALVDLRAIHFVRLGGVPLAQGNVAAAKAPSVLDGAAIVAKLLDDARPILERETLIASSLDRASELIPLMVAGLPAEQGSKEEYRRIPWIWRVAIAVGKSGDEKKMRSMLAVSLPKAAEPLTHWQAVVIGGGLINGITLSGGWPDETLNRIIGDDADLKTRWGHALKQSKAMADDESVSTGTRYDALRMVALMDWATAEPILKRYLGKGVHDELQMGAVSGLSDVRNDAAVVDLYVATFDHLSEGNSSLAKEALLRNDARKSRLKELLKDGKLPKSMSGIAESAQ